MSANRGVQAAQRRRAGQPETNAIPGRGPQPSINSAQMFANQARPGNGPSMPTGRLAGQQATAQQKQMQQDYYNQQGQPKEGLASVTKMSIPQAITLITLRLGLVESKIQSLADGGSINLSEGSGLDSSIFESIMSRLDALESRPQTTTSSASGSGSSSAEVNLLKQQFETLKQAVIQTKGTSTTLVKENIALKTQLDNMKKELIETKELLSALQNLTMDNSQKILDLSMNGNNGFPSDEVDLENTMIPMSGFTDLNELSDNSEIVGTDLKKMIESDLSLDGI